MKLRNSVKAWVVQDGCLLVIQKQTENGVVLRLPGGKQKKMETLDAALQRECKEELGVSVRMGELLAVYEYESDPPKQMRKVEFLFRCELLSGDVGTGAKPDTEQVGIMWLPLQYVDEDMFFPGTVAQLIQERGAIGYIGEI